MTTASYEKTINRLIADFAERLEYRGPYINHNAEYLCKEYAADIEEWGARTVLERLYDELRMEYERSYNNSAKLVKRALCKIRRQLDTLPIDA